MKAKREVTPAMRLALAEIATTQEAFWDALHTFEGLTGVEINGNNDFLGYSDPTDQDVIDVCEQGEQIRYSFRDEDEEEQ